MSALNDISSQALRSIGNLVHGTPAVFAINAGSAATVKTTNAILHTVNGIIKSRAALSAVALAAPTSSTSLIGGGTLDANEAAKWGFRVQPISKTCYYVLALDGQSTAGLVTFQGTWTDQDLSLRGSGVAKGDGLVPSIPAGFLPVGLIKVVTGSAAFTPATTALDAANITFTFYDIGGVLPVSTAP